MKSRISSSVVLCYSTTLMNTDSRQNFQTADRIFRGQIEISDRIFRGFTFCENPM